MSGTVILGADGQLGRELSLAFPEAEKFYHSRDNQPKVDFLQIDSLEQLLSEFKPDVILNASALAKVDLCENDRTLALTINGEAIRTLVKVARRFKSLLVHVSTDYVFDGKDGNYSEHAPPNPLNYYGLSKLIGDIYAQSYEDAIIVRTSGVFGYSNNYPMFVYKKLSKGEKVYAIKGNYSPIHAKNLALSIKRLTELDYRGVLNVAGEKISRLELAVKIAARFNFDDSLVSENDSISSMNAKRPYDSSLDITKAKKLLNFDFMSVDSNLAAFEERLSES